MKKFLTAALLSLGVLTATTAANAGELKAGVLSCHVESGWGWIIGSSKSAECVFTDSHGKKHHYNGQITKIGVDVGFTTGKNIAWVVMSANGEASDLSGNYMGVNAEATAIGGFGANVLIGGFNKNFTLQPLSVQGQVGLNVAAGAATLSLSK